MRFLLDEGIEIELAYDLRRDGHDVTVVRIDYPAGLADHHILATAWRERRILVTYDLGFGELVFVQNKPHAGVILLHLAGQPLDVRRERLRFTVAHHHAELTSFLVVDLQDVRTNPTRDRL